ncbi:MAG: hypothetical protein Q8941_18095 [Bacteroidota bacterium]|nr:hypothetical protein [Bacteroidota bacterium]
MKKYIILTAISVTAIALASFRFSSAGKLKLFPEIEKYYEGLPKTLSTDKYPEAFRDLTACVRMGSTSDKKINLLFTCSDNSFKSQVSQIILQSLLSVNKFNKLIVSSCGSQPAEVNPILIKLLLKHGFQANELSIAANGKKSYEIRFGDNMAPVIIYAKSSAEFSVPASDMFMASMCSDNAQCPQLKSARFNDWLPYSDIDMAASEAEFDKEFTAIAADIVYVFNKALS